MPKDEPPRAAESELEFQIERKRNRRKMYGVLAILAAIVTGLFLFFATSLSDTRTFTLYSKPAVLPNPDAKKVSAYFVNPPEPPRQKRSESSFAAGRQAVVVQTAPERTDE